MVLINKAVNEVTLKLVYYGPGLCGKTTNLEKIYAHPKLESKGKMISMATETDRTLFFDFLPMDLGTVGGQKIRVQLYTVPGQVFYDATRKLVLRGTDGVVFVADSQSSMREANLESFENLKTNLRANRLDPAKVAIVLQYNKRDLPNVDSVDEMNRYLNTDGIPAIEASAIRGEGVTDTLRAAVSRILDNLRNNVDVSLYDEAPLARPSLKVGAGVTHSSSGMSRVSVAGTVPTPEVRDPASARTQVGQIASPPVGAPQTSEGARETEQDPFDIEPEAPTAERPAPQNAAVAAMTRNGGGRRSLDRQSLSDLLAASEQVVQSLKRSLAAAEAQRDQLREALDRSGR